MRLQNEAVLFLGESFGMRGVPPTVCMISRSTSRVGKVKS